MFVTEFHRSPKCLRDALLSCELEEIRHGLREHGHELEHRGHGPKLIMKARLHTRRRMQMRAAATSSGPLRQAGHYTSCCRAKPNYGGKGKLSSFDCSPPVMWSQAASMHCSPPSMRSQGEVCTARCAPRPLLRRGVHRHFAGEAGRDLTAVGISREPKFGQSQTIRTSPQSTICVNTYNTISRTI